MFFGKNLRNVRFVLGHGGTYPMIVLATAVALLSLGTAIQAQDAAPAPSGQPIAAPAAPASPVAPAPAAPEEPGTVKMTQPGAFDIHARDTDLRVVLQLLSTQGRRNIVATKEVSGKVSADLYSVTFREALDAVLRATGFVYEEKGNFVYVYTPDQLEKIRKAERKLVVQGFRLVYITAADARTLITPALSSDGTIAITPTAAVGITPSKTDTGGNSYATDDVLVVRDDEEHVKRVADMIRELDVKPEQVLIEATVLRTTLDEHNALGFDFNALAGIDFGDISTDTGGLTSVDGTATSIRTDFTAGMDPGGLTVAFFSNNFDFLIRALESVAPTTVLANPKLLIINKQRGEVLIGDHQGYLTQTITETVATQTVQFLDTGTRLIVRPFIGKNGDVRMEIHPEDSIGTSQVLGNNIVPSSRTTEVTSNVIVRDGHTIVIGGLFREQTASNKSQVPVVGNVPYVGALFRRNDDRTVREEIIILITPRIIKQAVDEATSEQLKEQVERFRIGARKGLEWWGHDRLTVAFMREARKQLAAGDLNKAMWNLDIVLSLQPQCPEAIELKEQLTGKAYWSNEVRVSNSAYIVQKMMMQEMGKPYESIVTPLRPLDTNKMPADVRKAFDIMPELNEPLPAAAQEVLKPQVKMTPAPADQKADAKGVTTKPAGKK